MVSEFRLKSKKSLSSDFFLDLTESEKSEIFRLFPVTSIYWNLCQKPIEAVLPSRLRQQKAMDFLSAVAASYLEEFTTEEICRFWSDQAEKRIQISLDHGQSLLADPKPSWCVFAFGKLGSRELNLSSDVDLIWVSETSENQDLMAPLRSFQSDLQTENEWGFAHRIDFDLRPGGRMGPIISSFEQWWDYFSNFIDAWERLAFIRFRPLWGDPELVKKIEAHTTALTFRKYLDFSLIDEFKALRQQIHAQNWMRSENKVLDLKLGVGGIRDLELFIHTLQVIYGGKEPSVRVQGTAKAMIELQRLGALSQKDQKFLENHYWRLRHFENLSQARGDQQTHLIKEDFPEELFSPDDRKNLIADMKTCDLLVSTLFGQLNRNERSLPESLPDQKSWIASLGVSQEIVEKYWEDIFSQEVLSRQKSRDDQAKRSFVFQIITRGHELGSNLEILIPRLRDFIRKSRAKASLFHLLLSHPEQMDRLIHLLVSSLYLSQILINRPEILDVVLLERQPIHDPHRSWEEQVRVWKDRKFFSEILNGLNFLKDLDLEPLLASLTSTADSIALEILGQIKLEIESQVEILALGKWGGQEIGLSSDLDFIFVTPQDPTDVDFQVARRFMNRLAQGDPIYSIDLRLKPFGSSGMMMTSLPELERFLKSEAPAWQRQSYLKARWLTPGKSAQPIFEWATVPGLSSQDFKELGVIQSELHKKAKESPLKYSPGGLLDLELFVQTSLLKEKKVPSSSRMKDHLKIFASQWPAEIQSNYLRLRQLEQLYRLNSDQLFDHSSVSRRINTDAFQLEISQILSENVNYLMQLDPRIREG